MLSDYTSYNDIRSVLGVSDEELPDSAIELEVYQLGLDYDLRQVDPTLPATYQTLAAATTRSSAEQSLYSAVRLFAPYAVAQALLQSLPLFAPQEINDSKVKLARQSGPFAETMRRCEANFQRFRVNLRAALAVATSTSATIANYNFFAVASPATDPVRG